MSYRDTMVMLATSYVGVGMTPATRAQYLDLIAAGETPQRQLEMGAMSGCGLSIRGYLRLDGHDDARVRAPYKDQMAIAWLFAMAKERGAVIPARSTTRPDAGDIILVGGDPKKDGGPEHVFLVTNLDATDTIHSVDGGQVDAAGLQVIHARTRRWSTIGGRLWDAPTDGRSRRVQAWIDLDRLRG